MGPTALTVSSEQDFQLANNRSQGRSPWQCPFSAHSVSVTQVITAILRKARPGSVSLHTNDERGANTSARHCSVFKHANH